MFNLLASHQELQFWILLGPVYISNLFPLRLFKLLCITQEFNPTVQQGQRGSASKLRRLMLQRMQEKAQGDCCPSMRILSCRLFPLQSKYGLWIAMKSLQH